MVPGAWLSLVQSLSPSQTVRIPKGCFEVKRDLVCSIGTEGGQRNFGVIDGWSKWWGLPKLSLRRVGPGVGSKPSPFPSCDHRNPGFASQSLLGGPWVVIKGGYK